MNVPKNTQENKSNISTVSNSEKKQEQRSEFLLHLYDALWENIRSFENSIWQFLAVYGTILVASLSLIHTMSNSGGATKVPVIQFVVFAIITLSSIGIAIVIDRAKWFRRNLLFIINLEREFLFENDLGKIMPKHYHEKKDKILDGISWMYILMYILISLVMMYLFRHYLTWIIVLISVVYIIAILLIYCSAKIEIKEFINGTDTKKKQE